MTSAETSVWSPSLRPLTIGLVATITLVAAEALAVATVLPLVSRDLHGVALYGWVTSAFFLGTPIGLVVSGEQVDRRGPAGPFAAALAIFSAGLLVAGLAPAMWVVVVARALQGIGAGAISSATFASIGRTFPEHLRPRVFALISTAWVAPSLAGPAIAAGVGTWAGWRAVFLGLVPLVALAGTPAYRALRHVEQSHEPVERDSRTPIVAALRLTAGAVLVLGAIGRHSLLGLPLAAAGLLIGLAPLRRLMPPGTFSIRQGLPAVVAARGLLTFGFFGADAFVPLAVVAVRHRSTAFGGLALTSAAILWTAGSWCQERLATRWSARRFVGLGFAVLAVGTAAVATGLSHSVPIVVVPIAWGVAGYGIGLAYAPLSLAVLRQAPRGTEGAATAALQLSDALGVALGAGISGAAVAAGAASHRTALGIAAAYAACGLVTLVGLAASRRLPRDVLTQRRS